MMIRLSALAFLAAITSSQSPPATECWALTNLMGQVASAADSQFHADKFSNPMVLCFSKGNGSVPGDDTRFVRFDTLRWQGRPSMKALSWSRCRKLIAGGTKCSSRRVGSERTPSSQEAQTSSKRLSAPQS